MTVKWKIFFALNVILGLLSFILLLVLIIFFLTNSHTNEDYLFLAIFVFALSVIMFNSFLNIFLLQRYYPDKMVPRGTKGLTMLLFILSILVTVFFLLVSIFAAIEEFGRQAEDVDNNSGKIALAMISLLTVLQVIILVMQGQLPRLIRHNHQNSMHSLIDSIGQPSEQEN